MMRVYAGKSNIHGRGLCVRDDIQRGEKICFIKGSRVHKKNKTKADALANPDWVGISKYTWIDPAPPCKYLNHSCDPNAGIKGVVTLFALKNIEADEEVTVDYSTIEGDLRWELDGGVACCCGTKKCRGVIRSIQKLPQRRFEDYLPYIPTYFQNLYKKEHYE